jgi:translocation and assembly module TamB
MRVSGRVETRRGYAELVGKRFTIERANLFFTGSEEVDPLVDVMAVHEVAGRGSDQVIVYVTGPLSEPEIRFGSNVPGVETAGDALAMMMGGGRQNGSPATESEVGFDARNLLAGFTAGVLSLTARRELGDTFPVLSIESQNGGAALRAGMDAYRWVPDSLQGVVRGAYLEGFVATQGDQDGVEGSGGNTAGALLELTFPRDLVGRMQIAPPTGWGVDASWEP